MFACKGRVGVIGATSLIGECLLPLLVEDGYDVVAFSRRGQDTQLPLKNPHVEWQIIRQAEYFSSSDIFHPEKQISHWVFLAPIWVLPEYFLLLSLYGVKHIVAISSTSRFTKADSVDIIEQNLAKRLSDSEKCFVVWAKTKDVTWTILQPTLVYGLGHDKNISVIARFIQRFSFFPLLGTAQGLRQPLHVYDLALSCLASLNSEASINHSYNISGGETLPYREMIGRIFLAIDKKQRFVTFPLWLFRLAVMCLRVLPRFRHWSPAMAGRMNQDLVFDHGDASRDLGFAPRPFRLTREDLPALCSKMPS
jgi:nucleoside-diphosphate-sugar epimerase